MIAVRVLTPDDWPVWRALRLAALAEAPYAFGSRLADWQGSGDREERWRARLSGDGSVHVIAELDGEPAGMAGGFVAGEDGAAELVSMWVSPAARGGGVGTALVQAVERWTREVGARVLRLAVAQDNRAAVEFYRRNGFRYTGEPGGLMPDGVRREDIMAKVVSPLPGSAPSGAGTPPR